MKCIFAMLTTGAFLAGPAAALDKTEKDLMIKALSSCVSNIDSSRKSQKAIRSHGLEALYETDGIVSFATPDENFYVATGDRTFPHKICSAVGKDVSLREAEAIAAAFAKSLNATPDTSNDRQEISKSWNGTKGADYIGIAVQKSKDAGDFIAPAIAIIIPSL